MRSLRDERTGIELFRNNGWRYVLVESDINEERARLLIEGLSEFRDKDSGRFGAMILFVDAGASITEQGHTTLVEHGMKLYWPADWRRDEAATMNAQATVNGSEDAE